ncbi:hypothetical protein AB0M79_13590 [Polymorphospora sp. NPDC051019]|uniref:hypothetical protein n=1 Tax=Polymorphospora sp. NPDC051019 TaxID=3155725 RepID=UPI00343C3A11
MAGQRLRYRRGRRPRTRPAATATATATFVQPRAAIRSGNAFGRLLVGELRILVRGVSPWWWLGVAALATAGLLIPGDAVVGPLLLATCVWPVLIWSRLGTQHQEHGVDTLTGAYPARRRRLLAEWTAGVVLTALVGLAPAVRMVLATDWAAVAGWGAGTLLVPSLALGLGVLSRTHRLFQVVYLPLWYGVANDIAALDFIGAVRVDGRPVGPHPLAVLGIAAVMVGSAFVVASVRHRRR